jgi:hypothetical protein
MPPLNNLLFKKTDKKNRVNRANCSMIIIIKTANKNLMLTEGSTIFYLRGVIKINFPID